ncbi:MAG: cyanophycinase [Myxococcales bacterium]|nr:cyanophycinase [Myxococcales bacterium]
MGRALVLVLVAACGSGGATPGDPIDAVAADAAAPAPPPGLTRWLTGDAADAVTATRGGLILMGGGADVDAAFAWQRDRIGGGDVVVLRASGADGYNDYLYRAIGGVDSVETLLVDSAALAREPYVAWTIDHAEAVFLAGGDQAVYLAAWGDGPVAAALTAAHARGAVLGGTSAGCAVLGELVFAARNGSVYSDEALADPYNRFMTFARGFVAVPPLAQVITDTHFAARDRMGRLLAFVARALVDGTAARPLGLGIDEGTALVVDPDGVGTVVGAGAIYAVAPRDPPQACAAGAPLAWADVPVHELRAGDTIALPAGTTAVPPRSIAAAGGATVPADPY